MEICKNHNLLHIFNDAAQHEEFKDLLKTSHFRLEHIVSHGEANPAEFWYDQEENEWVMLLQGRAILQFEHTSQHLQAGDSLLIPAHQKHRVEMCSQDAIWLALFFIDPPIET